MEVYRITTAKYAEKLSASGAPNRWNVENQYVIYSAESRALAILEMVAHRSAKMRKDNFKMLTIEIPESKKYIEKFSEKRLPPDWRTIKAYDELQNLGAEWYRSQRTPILMVPSVLVENEFNYIINTVHPSFRENFHLKAAKDFVWDKRLI